MKTKIGKKIGKCQSETAFCELILRVGAMEERLAYLEGKCKYPIGLSWTACSHTGQPYYVNLAREQGVVAH
jgi:hypothetical protein